MSKHICSPCNKEFATEAEYLAHVCVKSGKKPTEQDHLKNTTTPHIAKVSAGALKRGADKVAKPATPAK